MLLKWFYFCLNFYLLRGQTNGCIKYRICYNFIRVVSFTILFLRLQSTQILKYQVLMTAKLTELGATVI